jgi:ornithine cyclodeaminase/alanine dehydrogenase-like protein (mu-crystallin family)
VAPGDDAASWVAAVEDAYVAARGGSAERVASDRVTPALRAKALAAVGAVASHHLAVSSPRSIGLVGDAADNALSLAAHRVWFEPRDLRCHGGMVEGGRDVSLADALAADIVCIHRPTVIAAGQLRRGTHVNALAPVTLDPDLDADVVHAGADLAALAAGLRGGRKLDEITVLVADDVEIAIAALSRRT